MPLDLALFGNPWEHVRLLSDAARNQALIELLARRAPGARVLEVGCGTGLLSCVAARLGATHVYAVEPTPMVEEARAMVAANRLEGVVEVLQGKVEDLWPRQVDLVFSELLNADPFSEGVLPAMSAAKSWLAPGGRLAPTRLRVYAAAVREADTAREVREARREVAGLAARFGLDLGRLDALIAAPGPYAHVTHVQALATEPVLVWDLGVGVDRRPEAAVELELIASEPGPVGGVCVWFEADLDEGIQMANRPGEGGHWGQLVCAWPAERGMRQGGVLPVRITVDDEGVLVVPA